MAQQREVVVCNTCYRKKEEHLITFSSGGRCSQIDYILVNKKEIKNLKNCKVMLGSHVVNQHNLVVLDMWCGKTTKAKVTRKGRFRTWELKKTDKKEPFKMMMKDKFQCWSERLGVDEMWGEMKQAVMEAAEVTIGRTKLGRRTQREEWWWCEEVRESLKEEKIAFKGLRKSGLEADREEYNAKKEAKRSVAVAKKEGTATLYEELYTREGEVKIYRITMARQREREGTGNINIVKNREER